MPDWNSSMKQTFEFYEVDPNTWQDKRAVKTITSCTITWDETSSLLGNAGFECTDSIGEYYIRVYLITEQRGVKERFPLGTFLIQTPSGKFDGKKTDISIDAYTPLIELKEKLPPVGYSIRQNLNAMELAYQLCRENMRAPVVTADSSQTTTGNFVSNLDDTWLTFLTDFIASVKFSFYLDEFGRVLFTPKQDIASLQPVWEYSDDNSSILYPEIESERDLYGIPNVVEVLYSDDTTSLFSRIVNDDANSPISTVNRGREIVYRETDPDIVGAPTHATLDQYATQLLRNLSSLECTITYTHGYCPVRVGDCVLLNYTRAGLTNIKAKVISQSIKCESGCPVSETAVYTTKLWG